MKPANTEELATNPSNITKDLLNIVVRLNNKYESQFKAKNIFRKFSIDFRINSYLKEGCMDFYLFLKNYKIPDFGGKKAEKLKKLLKEFEDLYDKLLFNNFCLAYAYTKSKNKEIKNPILTMEGKKNMLLKKLAKKQLTAEQFKKEFGHYALNAYELSSRRFDEYNSKELMKIAKLAENLEMKEKMEFEDYLKLQKKEIIPILIALRELAKYKALLIIREIRKELLKIAREKNIKDIFSLSFNNIVTIR